MKQPCVSPNTKTQVLHKFWETELIGINTVDPKITNDLYENRFFKYLRFIARVFFIRCLCVFTRKTGGRCQPRFQKFNMQFQENRYEVAHPNGRKVTMSSLTIILSA